MTAAVELPEGLADLPPGPGLAALLAGIDATRLANNQLLPVLGAQYRQAAHEAARLLGIIAEIGRANPTFDDGAVDRLPHPFLHASDEVRAGLAWSRRAAERECELAEQLVHELPIVYAAFLGGILDRSKVRVFADHLSGLTPDQIQQICQALVPIAGRLTPGQIAHRLRRLIAAIDPRHYERRYRKALRDRYVTAYLDDHGVAVLSARGLTPTQAAAALERIDLLAHAARRDGHPSTLDQIRVDILAGLLDGTLHQMTREQIITHLITTRSPNDDAPTSPACTAPGTAAEAATRSDAPTSPTSAQPIRPQPGREQPCGPQRPTPQPPAAPQPPPPQPVEAQPVEAQPVEAQPASGPQPPAAQPPGAREDQRVGVEIRVALSTLLGHDEQPGEIPAFGPVPATEARHTVNQQRRAEWRYAIVDTNGRLLFDGITRRRPTGLPTNGPPGGIVEIHIPASLRTQLTDRRPALEQPAPEQVAHGQSAPAAWAGVLADIARQYAERRTRDLDAHPHDRFPRAALRRHTQIRDRSCAGPGCRQRPQRCDQDHTTEHHHGGETVAADLAPLCRHDHTLKGEAGWDLQQPTAGAFIWTTPLGGRYEVLPEPILPPLPPPVASPDDPIHDEPAPDSPQTLPLYRPDPPPPNPDPPPTDDPEEPPPF